MSINENVSFIEYNVEQPTQDFVTNFDTIGGTTDVVLVTVDGVLTDTPESVYTVQQINHTTWRVTPEVPTDSVVRLYRVTNIDEMMHVFTAGAKFIARNMDNNFKQIRHAQQEVRDAFDFLEYNTLGVVEAARDATERANNVAAEVEELLDSELAHNDLHGRDILGAHPDSAITTWSGSTQAAKNMELVSANDFETLRENIQAAILNNGLLLLNDATFTLTVGTGGDFGKLSDALAQASRMKLNYKNGNIGLIEIKLLSGYSLDEQIIVRDGQDLSFCVLRSDDAVVPISINPPAPDFANSDSNNAIFIGYNGAKLPIIGTKFQYATTGTSDGVAVLHGSRVVFEPSAGILGCRNGLKVLYGSEAYCYMQGLTIGGDGAGAGDVVGVQFPDCSNRGLHVAYGSRVGLARSNFTGCSGHNAYFIWNSFGDLYQSDLSGCVSVDQAAVYIRDGSVVSMREACVADNAYIGLHAMHGAIVDARSRISAASPSDPNWHKWIKRGYRGNVSRSIFASYGCLIEAAEACVDGTNGRGVDAADGSTVIFTEGSAKNCSSYGLFSQRGSTITALSVDVSGSTNGMVATSGSTISASNSTGLNCNRTVNSESGSVIDVTGIVCTGALDFAIRCVDATVCANNGNANNSKNGVYANGGTVQFKDGTANGCTEVGVGAYEGGTISASRVNASGCKRGIESSAATVIAKNATANNCTERGLSAIDGGYLNAYGATITGSSSFAATARNGSHINITGADLGDRVPNWQSGSTVIAHSYTTTGSDTLTWNTVSSSGIGYK